MGNRLSRRQSTITYEEENFTRFGKGIVGTGTKILQEVLETYIPSKEIAIKLTNTSHPNLWKKLNPQQKLLIGQCATDGYKNFDITLCYTLLRNLNVHVNAPFSTPFPKPIGGWGNKPLVTNTAPSDDIERIRILRNEICHAPQPSIPTIQFTDNWKQFKDICTRMKANYPSMTYFRQELKALESCKVTRVEWASIVQVMQQIREQEENIEEHAWKLTQLETQQKQLQRQSSENKSHFDTLDRSVQIHSAKLDKHCTQLNGYGAQLKRHGSKIDEQASTIEDQGIRLYERVSQLDDHGTKLDDHDDKIDDHDAKLNDHEDKLHDHDTKLDEHSSQIEDHAAHIDENTRSLDTVKTEVKRQGQQIAEHSRQFATLNQQDGPRVNEQERQNPDNTEVMRNGRIKKIVFLSLTIIIAIGSILLYQWYPSEILAKPAPFKKLKFFLPATEGRWGTYLPSTYFGFSTASAHSPYIGLLFFEQQTNQWHSHCNGRITSFMWNRHDGINFGSQTIKTNNLNLTTEFMRDLRDLGSWETRAYTENKIQLCMIVHVPGSGTIRKYRSGGYQNVIEVQTKEHGKAFLKIRANKKLEIDHLNIYCRTNYFNVDAIKQSLNESIDQNARRNAIAICTQYSYPTRLSVRISNYKDDKKEPMSPEQFHNDLGIWYDVFDNKFNTTFHTISQFFRCHEIETAKIALSNVLGSIGFFRDASVAVDAHTGQKYRYFEESLYTSTPSRVLQAHGHFWDDGFHNMLITKWDINISIRILTHWLDLMDNRGWIPREQILDDYSKQTIPEKYIPQLNDNFSPPTFLLPLQYIAEYLAYGTKGDHVLLREILKRVRLWFGLFISSQKGKLSHSYRWRGRNDPSNINQTNKMTLASGLDDYPRALFPDELERHLDLRCWITMATRILVRLCDLAKEDRSEYETLYKELKDETLLNRLHWDEENKHYGDYGFDLRNFNDTTDRLYKIVDNIGYVSLFPFLVKILDPNSEKLSYIIDDLKSPNKLWTIYGIRSLSQSNPYYQRKNEKHDTPQWRGSIRININYLIIGALKYYSEQSAKYGTEFKSLYLSLRANVIRNIINVFIQQGNFYERYNDINGKGEGHFPSTGTSSMLVLIMSETYY